MGGRSEIVRDVARCAQLAMLLEVSAYPKPGNVHRTSDFAETRYEHFLASSVAVMPYLELAAARGVEVAVGERKPGATGLGKLIRDSVRESLSWQRGGNTSLGTLILLLPLASAASCTLTGSRDPFSAKVLRSNIPVFTESTKAEDTIDLYEAIRISEPGGLRKVDRLDVNSPSSYTEILEKDISVYDVFKLAAGYDSIAREWILRYPVTFEIGAPTFLREFEEKGDVNTAVVHTFLRILSEVPDTLISRKTDSQKARSVSRRAEEILRVGGLEAVEGMKLLRDLDGELRTPDHRLNPGSTADLTASSLMTALLMGFRP